MPYCCSAAAPAALCCSRAAPPLLPSGAPANASCTSSSCASSCTPVTSTTQPSTAAAGRGRCTGRVSGASGQWSSCSLKLHRFVQPQPMVPCTLAATARHPASHLAGPGPALSAGSDSNWPPCSRSSSSMGSRKPRPCGAGQRSRQRRSATGSGSGGAATCSGGRAGQRRCAPGAGYELRGVSGRPRAAPGATHEPSGSPSACGRLREAGRRPCLLTNPCSAWRRATGLSARKRPAIRRRWRTTASGTRCEAGQREIVTCTP